MKKEFLKVSIRKQAIYIPDDFITSDFNGVNETTSVLIANVKTLGFTFSESLLRALNGVSPSIKLDILETLKEITGVDKNWTPLVKGWDIPTGESVVDHLITLVVNVFGGKKGTTLPCGHLIPENTFPLERYNGCPFCGTPFEFGEIENYGQGSKLKVLELWSDKDLEDHFNNLLISKTALDATQVDSLISLLKHFPLPKEATISMKETVMLAVDTLVENERDDEAGSLFKTPNDVLRYLWYKHTGFLQIIEPKVLLKRKTSNHRHLHPSLDNSVAVAKQTTNNLKLKYSRVECRRVAKWLNGLEIDAEKACEIMHPKRNMWVRFIRALRLSEYSKKEGFEKLASLLDTFHNEGYTVWQGKINHYRLRQYPDKAFAILRTRPGLFARSLFSNMLWFGADETLKHFRMIKDQIPARLMLTLNMYAGYYFDKNASRTVHPLGGTSKRIPANKFLQLYNDDQLKQMQSKIEDLSIEVIQDRFSKAENDNKTIFIDEGLFNIPLSIGDRSETIQDLPSALMGMRFPVEGSTIRLFMQWGVGLHKQHLDMDLSCRVAYDDRTDFCSYSQLVITGCKHSGDIQRIPEKVGTAEYIDVNFDELSKANAKYVSFTCNAYSGGSISPNLVVGWMDSKYPMRISEKTGVAYDPSCVQHQVRITQGNMKGLVFGVLDVEKREIVWLEMSFGGQIVQNLDTKGVEALLTKLNSKLNIGYLLQLKAEAQNLEIVDQTKAADEAYDMKWAMNTAAVTQLFLD